MKPANDLKQVQKGFTLIELMIVVAVIGILAAVAIPAYQEYVVKSRLSKVQSTLYPVKIALVSYYQQNGSFINGASTSNTAPADFWNSLGLPNGATMPNEVDGAAFVVSGTSGTNVTIDLKLQNIKTTMINGITITLTGSADSTAMQWTCTATSGTLDPIAKKYFDCP